MKTLVIANQKGGVGKTTLTVHLAYAAVEAGRRVLLVDLDRQGSLSLSFPSSQAASEQSTTMFASSLFGSAGGTPEVIDEHMSIIRSDAALMALERADPGFARKPRLALQQIKGYDLCLIDTPPTLGLGLIAGLTAADAVVTPVNIGLYELAAVGDLMRTIQKVRTQGMNPKLKHVGILLMKTNSRSAEEVAAAQDLRKKYGNAILPMQLTERAAVRKAVVKRKPVWASPNGEGHRNAALEWKAATQHILAKV
jgi:chromosome partitioning protein